MFKEGIDTSVACYSWDIFMDESSVYKEREDLSTPFLCASIAASPLSMALFVSFLNLVSKGVSLLMKLAVLRFSFVKILARVA